MLYIKRPRENTCAVHQRQNIAAACHMHVWPLWACDNISRSLGILAPDVPKGLCRLCPVHLRYSVAHAKGVHAADGGRSSRGSHLHKLGVGLCRKDRIALEDWADAGQVQVVNLPRCREVSADHLAIKREANSWASTRRRQEPPWIQTQIHSQELSRPATPQCR